MCCVHFIFKQGTHRIYSIILKSQTLEPDCLSVNAYSNIFLLHDLTTFL